MHFPVNNRDVCRVQHSSFTMEVLHLYISAYTAGQGWGIFSDLHKLETFVRLIYSYMIYDLIKTCRIWHCVWPWHCWYGILTELYTLCYNASSSLGNSWGIPGLNLFTFCNTWGWSCKGWSKYRSMYSNQPKWFVCTTIHECLAFHSINCICPTKVSN